MSGSYYMAEQAAGPKVREEEERGEGEGVEGKSDHL